MLLSICRGGEGDTISKTPPHGYAHPVCILILWFDVTDDAIVCYFSFLGDLYEMDEKNISVPPMSLTTLKSHHISFVISLVNFGLSGPFIR